MTITRTFTETGDFAAFYAAERMAADLGLSIGSMERDQPIGLMHGDYSIAKWRNLSKSERQELHGVITGPKRMGPVRLSIFANCPEAIRSAARGMGAGVDTSAPERAA